jgi:hypothetical protein
MPISVAESLSVAGNANHIGCFLKDFEDAIDQNDESNKVLTKAPHYFAWINAASEHVYYRIREMIYINTENSDVFDESYKSLLDRIIDIGKLNDEQVEAIVLFARIRNLLVHKGFPNPHISPSQSERCIAKGRPFTVREVKALAERLRSPSCYPELRNQLRIALQAISACEQEFTHNFGLFQISKGR